MHMAEHDSSIKSTLDFIFKIFSALIHRKDKFANDDSVIIMTLQ